MRPGARCKCIGRSAFYVEAYRLYSDAATIRGRASEAMGVLARPLSVLPRDKVLRFAATTTMLQSGRATEAEAFARESLRWEPDWPLGHWELGRALEAQGLQDEAEAEFRRILGGDPANQRFVAALAHLLAGRRHQEAMSMLLEAGMDQTAPALAGLVEAKSGNPEQALRWMEQAEQQHDHNLPYAVIDQHYEGLREVERGKRLYDRFVG